MNIRLSDSNEWRQFAIVEVPDSTQDFLKLVRDDTLKFRVQRAEKCPTGYHWYEIFVDPSGGERLAARTACAVLTALKRSAKEGFLDDLRIISGEQWLSIGQCDPEIEDALPSRDTYATG